MAGLRAIVRRIPGTRSIWRLIRLGRLARSYREFRTMAAGNKRFRLRWRDRLPCLDDATPDLAYDRHYVLHCAWAARLLARLRPERHVDIGSLLAFSTQLSAFMPVAFYDFRPPAVRLDGLAVGHADLTSLPFPSASVRSLSCMHTVEHVGLGRYGDRLDPDGDLKAIAELKRVLAIGGSLLFVVPVGLATIRFNAHRIYAFEQIRSLFAPLELREYALIPDDPADGDLVSAPTPELQARQRYGCGCFCFTRTA